MPLSMEKLPSPSAIHRHCATLGLGSWPSGQARRVPTRQVGKAPSVALEPCVRGTVDASRTGTQGCEDGCGVAATSTSQSDLHRVQWPRLELVAWVWMSRFGLGGYGSAKPLAERSERVIATRSHWTCWHQRRKGASGATVEDTYSHAQSIW